MFEEGRGQRHLGVADMVVFEDAGAFGVCEEVEGAGGLGVFVG